MAFADEAKDAFRRGDDATVERLTAAELQRARADNDLAGETGAMIMLTRLAVRKGDLDEGARLAGEALAKVQDTADPRLLRMPVHALAAVARMTGDVATARARYAQSIELAEQVGSGLGVASEQHNLAHVELQAGNLAGARELFRSSRERVLADGYDDFLPYVVLGAAVLAGAEGHPRRAANLLAAADGAFRAVGEIPDPDDAETRTELEDALTAALGPDAFDDEYAKGTEAEPLEVLTGQRRQPSTR